MKKTILIVSFTLFVFCLFLFRGSDGLFIQLAGLAKESVEKILYNEHSFPVLPEQFLVCKKNRDCILAEYPCGEIAIHRSYKRKYDSWRKKAFSGYDFDCMNDLSYYEPQCINFKCKEVKIEIDKCDTDEDCLLVRKDCCGCVDLAIHQSKWDSYTDEFNQRCRGKDCSLETENKQKCVTGPDSPISRCLKSQCVIEKN